MFEAGGMDGKKFDLTHADFVALKQHLMVRRRKANPSHIHEILERVRREVAHA
jgi:hypothetical protein